VRGQFIRDVFGVLCLHTHQYTMCSSLTEEPHWAALPLLEREGDAAAIPQSVAMNVPVLLRGCVYIAIGQPFMRNGVRTLAAHSQLSTAVTSKESQEKVPRCVIGIWFVAVQGRVCQVMLQGKELSYACVET